MSKKIVKVKEIPQAATQNVYGEEVSSLRLAEEVSYRADQCLRQSTPFFKEVSIQPPIRGLCSTSRLFDKVLDPANSQQITDPAYELLASRAKNPKNPGYVDTPIPSFIQ